MAHLRFQQEAGDNARKTREVLSAADKIPTERRATPTKRVASKDQVAATGTSRPTLDRAERHVAAAERYPWMQGNQWRQSDVLQCR